MNISQIQENLDKVLGDLNRDEFIYELLSAYGKPKASISRLKNGTYNLSKNANEVLWKKEVLFTYKDHGNLHTVIDEIRKSDLISKHKPRFLIVTNFELFLAIDTKTNETLDVNFAELDKNFDFFLPWAGMEKAQRQNENPADVKAAEKMAKLYDEILKDNPAKTKDEIHNLNVFLTRLLFCFFAEDTQIFKLNCFTNLIISHTQEDGSDLDVHLKKLFHVLSDANREGLPEYLKVFPYVNGGLFTEEISAPKFTRRSRSMIIESGELDWSAINPDIFGSMFQAVVHTDQRAEMGMHYTSVPNIMKVIEPLFLDELNEAFDKNYDSESKLEQLLVRLENIKIFDPACGSGNFLIIAYKEIRILEMRVLSRIREISKNKSSRFSNISLAQFYGIELDDFAHEVAILSLWLAEHQMNVQFKEIFGNANPSLPLKKGGRIVCENAATIDWKEVCPISNDSEIYVIGNPPYVGGKSQSKIQKQDMEIVFSGIKNFKELDYISCWFFKASKYINEKSKFAFVTTSSLNQGAQVEQLWSLIFDRGIDIVFAYKPFIWSNNAKSNAGVACSIVGLCYSPKHKFLIEGSLKKEVTNINAYLMPTSNVIVRKSLQPISNLPEILTGNSPYENGNLTLSKDESVELLTKHPEIEPLIRKVYGADEFLNGLERYCLWISNEQLELANSVPEITRRIEKTKEFRLQGGEVARGIANRSHQFRYTHSAKNTQIIIPIVSSERREYLPVGFLNNEFIIISSAAAIYDCKPYVFSIISSKMHMAWVRLTAGRLENRLRYLSALCYNTFPFPEVNNTTIDELQKSTFRILHEREQRSELTVAQLYDPLKMPAELRNAHELNDILVDRCYRSKPFNSDEERLEHLLRLYEDFTNKEKR